MTTSSSLAAARCLRLAPCRSSTPRRSTPFWTSQEAGLATAATAATTAPPHALASPMQQTQNVRAITELMAEVRGTHPHRIKVQMPTRLAPRRSWANHVQSPATAEAQAHNAPSEVAAELLKPKHMRDSYVELYLPFSEDPELLEKYIATSGLIRLGKVLEDLDTLAGNISYQHALGASPRAGDASAPMYIVTASVDRLDLLEPLVANANYRLSGHVIYVGSSSMEVFVSIERLGHQPAAQDKVCLTGRFTMAARNAKTLKSQKIAPLLVETEAEQRLYAIGEGFKERKRQEAATSLERVPPTKEEAHLLHRQYLEGLRSGLFSTDEPKPTAAAANGTSTASNEAERTQPVPVHATAMQATMHMHPQQRNVHGKVFGGFLMRSAYELAWMVAASFAKRHVQFLSLDALSFHAPVPIGAMLRLSSQITYCQDAGGLEPHQPVVAGVSVLAEVVDLATAQAQKSNTFHFSFDIGSTGKRLMPQTYKEAMEWIEGKRRVELGSEMRTLYQQS
ncbi:hypothetical protein ACQY0O_003249 [Thecaphora frezii]